MDPRAIDAARQMGITVHQAKEQASAMGMTLGQLLGYEVAPVAEEAFKYEYGKPLVKPGTKLTTRLRQLHDWYMTSTNKHGRQYIVVQLKRDEHYFRDAAIQFDVKELFDLFNQDALDISLVSCYCL